MNVKQKIKALIYLAKEKIVVLYEVGKNPDTPLLAKIIVVIALAYALSPIDLIPDFIPILGYLDDVIILSGLIFIAYKLIPESIWQEAVKKSKSHTDPLPENWLMAIIIILVWITLACYLIYLLF